LWDLYDGVEDIATARRFPTVRLRDYARLTSLSRNELRWIRGVERVEGAHIRPIRVELDTEQVAAAVLVVAAAAPRRGRTRLALWPWPREVGVRPP